MSRYEQYYLQVTAGPSYDQTTQEVVPVNAEKPVRITHETMDLDLTVRIRNYRGVPEGSPSTCKYFESPDHTRDQYSIAFTFVPKKDINGDSIIFGNDLDHPVRNKLPPGYKQAFKIMTWFIDTSLWGDPSSETPYLYGPALSSLNAFSVAKEKTENVPAWEGGALAEDASAAEGVPAGASARKKYFLDEKKREDFVFEKGRAYSFDFFNPYLDFNEMALKLPGFSIDILKYWDKSEIDKEHRLRYVCKDRNSGEVYFVVVLTLLKKVAAEGEKLLTEEEQIAKGYMKRDPPQDGVIKYLSKPSGGFLVGGDSHSARGSSSESSSDAESKKNEGNLPKGDKQATLKDDKAGKGVAVESTSADDVD